MEETLIYSGEWFQKDAVSMSRLTGIMPMEDQFAPKKKWFPDSSWTAGPWQSDRQAVQKAGRRAGDRHSDRLIFLYLMSYKQERGTLFTFFFVSFCFIVAITNMLYCFSYQGPSLVLQTQGLFDTISLRLFLQFAWEPVYEYLCIIVTGKMYLRLVEFLWNLLYWVLSS